MPSTQRSIALLPGSIDNSHLNTILSFQRTFSDIPPILLFLGRNDMANIELRYREKFAEANRTLTTFSSILGGAIQGTEGTLPDYEALMAAYDTFFTVFARDHTSYGVVEKNTPLGQIQRVDKILRSDGFVQAYNAWRTLRDPSVPLQLAYRAMAELPEPLLALHELSPLLGRLRERFDGVQSSSSAGLPDCDALIRYAGIMRNQVEHKQFAPVAEAMQGVRQTKVIEGPALDAELIRNDRERTAVLDQIDALMAIIQGQSFRLAYEEWRSEVDHAVPSASPPIAVASTDAANEATIRTGLATKWGDFERIHRLTSGRGGLSKLSEMARALAANQWIDVPAGGVDQLWDIIQIELGTIHKRGWDDDFARALGFSPQQLTRQVFGEMCAENALNCSHRGDRWTIGASQSPS
jgi:hypothetical protein